MPSAPFKFQDDVALNKDAWLGEEGGIHSAIILHQRQDMASGCLRLEGVSSSLGYIKSPSFHRHPIVTSTSSSYSTPSITSVRNHEIGKCVARFQFSVCSVNSSMETGLCFPPGFHCWLRGCRCDGPIVAGCPRRRPRSPGKVRGGGGGDPQRPIGRWRVEASGTGLVAGRRLPDGGRAFLFVGSAGADDGGRHPGASPGHPVQQLPSALLPRSVDPQGLLRRQSIRLRLRLNRLHRSPDGLLILCRRWSLIVCVEPPVPNPNELFITVMLITCCN